MSRWTPFLLVVATLAGAACTPCTQKQTTLTQSDGGAFRCVTSEDCPRTANDTVCITSGPLTYTGACVICTSTECLRRVESCQ